MARMTLKEMKEIVTKNGLNFDSWSEQVINEKRLQIIDKDKAYFNSWKDEVLNDAVISLVIEKCKTNQESNKIEQSQSKHSQK